jgi:acyl-coenzyme A thioesterase PaaI-like protein
MEKQPNSRMCFVCGIENPIGLKLRFYTDDEGRCIARFRPKPEHQGYPGQLHGGIISALLDEPTQISVLASVLAV